ncbi:MAG: hypothetical protein LBP62_02125 [Clostridiales bacterium]|jgi:hypothetical protein|nr:hypothetical protein [Clostridiales bacterium]
MDSAAGYEFTRFGRLHGFDDADEVYQEMEKQAKEKFDNGEYILKYLDTKGQHLNIEFELKGKRDKYEKVYIFYTGWIAYPNAKIKMATPFGGWVE